MRALLPKMTHAERCARAAAKQQILLEFLASGEVYTTTDIATDLLQITRRRAAACLAALERAGALKSETHSVNARQIKIYGVTPHGLAMADAPASAPYFELGRTNPAWINHRLDTQRMRIHAEGASWSDWTPERALRLQSLKKIPDAVATNPAGSRIAIEIERFAKTPKRYGELICAYLQEIKSGKYEEVHFVSPPGIERLIQNAFRKVESVKFNGEIVKLEAKHFARFKFFSFSDWPPCEGELSHD